MHTPDNRACASFDNLSGTFSGALFIFLNSCCLHIYIYIYYILFLYLSLVKYGGSPTNISYMTTPNRYQSTDFPWP